MGFLDSVIRYTNQIMLTVVITVAVMVGILFYLLKVKKIASKEEHKNTIHFERASSKRFIPFEDIIYCGDTLDSPGVIVLPGYQFVAGVSVTGYDYHSASAEERLSTRIHSAQFFDILEELISFRQTSSRVDLSPNIVEYEEAAKHIEMTLLDKKAEFNEVCTMADDYVDEPEKYAVYSQQMNSLKKAVESLEFQLNECMTVIQYMRIQTQESTEQDEAVGLSDSQTMFSYTYKPDQYLKELSKQEIYYKAIKEIERKAAMYIDAYSRCSFSARPLTTLELVKLLYKHAHPLTGEDWDMKDLLSSSLFASFVSSSSIEDAVREKLGEEEYLRQAQEWEEQQVSQRAGYEAQAARNAQATEQIVTNRILEGQ